MIVLMSMIIDGKNAILGRLSTQIAKRLLKGEEITVINADKIIITGNPKQILGKYAARRKRGSTEKGPYFPKTPEAIVRRTIRGMLPYKTSRGREAFKRLRVYVDVPPLKGDITSLPTKEVKANFLTVEKLASLIGWKRVKD